VLVKLCPVFTISQIVGYIYGSIKQKNVHDLETLVDAFTLKMAVRTVEHGLFTVSANGWNTNAPDSFSNTIKHIEITWAKSTPSTTTHWWRVCNMSTYEESNLFITQLISFHI